MIDVPVVTPFTVPNPTEAMAPLLLLQVPPAGVLASSVVDPTHMTGAPVNAEGEAYIVNIVVLKHPVGSL